ncbi:MAG: YigZ family protein [Flavobacteriaceae bacterium]|nr:YigZ family protein [Flavobacteriaceae bacterium]
MAESKDTYKTIEKAFAGDLFKDRGSKFFGYAFPITSEEDVKIQIEELKKEHHTARHWCYAWQLGTEKIRYRANDDGEPSNSAGQPIYGQIQSFDVTNVLLVVVRYFGGTKLGVGGLINAYRTGAQLALENATIIEKTIDFHYQLIFDYPLMNKVMRIIKEHDLRIINQKLELHCEYTLAIRKKDASRFFEIFENLYGATIKELES